MLVRSTLATKESSGKQYTTARNAIYDRQECNLALPQLSVVLTSLGSTLNLYSSTVWGMTAKRRENVVLQAGEDDGTRSRWQEKMMAREVDGTRGWYEMMTGPEHDGTRMMV